MKYFFLTLCLAALTSCFGPDCVDPDSDLIDRGCGNLFTYKTYDALDNTYIWVRADRDALTLTEDFTTFDLKDNMAITAGIETFLLDGHPFCTDVVIVGQTTTALWTAIEGTVSIRVVRPPNDCTETYVVDVILQNAVFEDAKGDQILVDEVRYERVWVNFLIG